MTDHEHEATNYGGQLPRRQPLDTFAQHGAPPEPPIQPEGGRLWVSPGTPPWGSLSQDIGHREPRMSWRSQWAVMNPVAKLALILGLVVIVLAVVAVTVQRSNVLPAGFPLIGKDKGVAACEVLAKGNGPTGQTGKASADDMRKARAVFAASRYPAIRDNGVKLMDLAVQIDGLGDDPGLGALTYISEFTSAYAGLAGGCASVGHPIPALTSK